MEKFGLVDKTKDELIDIALEKRRNRKRVEDGVGNCQCTVGSYRKRVGEKR